jgi:hypothetical protein
MGSMSPRMIAADASMFAGGVKMLPGERVPCLAGELLEEGPPGAIGT